MPTVWFNGQLLDESQAAVSIRDTGLLHAAGVFTTMRAYTGRVFRLEQHLQRLRKSSEALFVPLQYKDDALKQAAADVLSANHLADARVRITITRGLSQQDPLHGLRLNPTVFITAATFEAYPAEYYQRGMTAVLLDEQKLNPYDIQSGHKTLNYFSRLFALKSANERGAGEALWFNVHNYLQSGSISNVFIVKNEKLITPVIADDLKDPAIAAKVPYPRSAVLPGITRATVLELAHREKISVQPGAIDVNQLLDADEIFITNSVMGIMPICRIERRIIADDRPGPLTRRLTDLYASTIQDELINPA